jgi:non-ribosomal peptide synthetase-like protein
LEEIVAGHMATVFGLASVSCTANFFLDLGGHSLFAAQLLGKLRQESDFVDLSIADLYSNPTVRSLVEFAATEADEDGDGDGDGSGGGDQMVGFGESASSRSSASRSSMGRRASQRLPGPPAAIATPYLLSERRRLRILCGCAQTVALLVMATVYTLPISFIYASYRTNVVIASLQARYWSYIFFPIYYFVVGLSLPIIFQPFAKRYLKPGRYNLWGWEYFVKWLWGRVLGLSPVGLMMGSSIAPWYARVLGAKVGKGVVLASFPELPFLSYFGDYCAIGSGSELRNVVVNTSDLRIGSIYVGAGAYIGTNASVMGRTVIGAGAELADQSNLDEGWEIPPGQRWFGSPSRPTSDKDHVVESCKVGGPVKEEASTFFFLLQLLLLFFVLMFPLLCFVPPIALIYYCLMTYGLVGAFAAPILAGPIFVATVCVFIFFVKMVLVGRLSAGIYTVNSMSGTRKWLGDQMMGLSLQLTNSIYGTLYAGPWLRCLGANVGNFAEVSTASHVDPDLLTIEEESFVADQVSLGAAVFWGGKIALGPTHVGARSFLGNSSVITGNTIIGTGSLVGVASTSPATRNVPDGTSWLGSPPIFLPNRQKIEGITEADTFKPPLYMVFLRLFMEWLRVTLPPALIMIDTTMIIVAMFWITESEIPVWAIFVGCPLVVSAGSFVITMVVFIMKWLLVGAYKERISPLWTNFVWRSELITACYESVAIPFMVGWLSGTPMLPSILRLIGVKLGHGILLDTTFMTEFDLVEIGDDSVIGSNTDLQTHLFEDRVMKMGHVRIGNCVSVGSRCVILYATKLEDFSELAALSLAMKGESVPANGVWQGIPARKGVAPPKPGGGAGRGAGQHQRPASQRDVENHTYPAQQMNNPMWVESNSSTSTKRTDFHV